MLPETISVELTMSPVSWSRPQGKSVRFDGQVDDKAAFSVKFLRDAYKNYPALRDMPRPWFTDELVRVEVLFGMKAKHFRRKDLDNLTKFTLDAMQSQMLEGVIWKDDVQVAVIEAKKIVVLDIADEYIALSVSKLTP
jgi:hypothetical protein